MCHTEGLYPNARKRAHPAYAKQKLLHDAAVEVRPIETCRQLFVVFRIRFQIGIQKIEGNPSDPDFPQSQGHNPVREFHIHTQAISSVVQNRQGRQVVENPAYC